MLFVKTLLLDLNYGRISSPVWVNTLVKLVLQVEPWSNKRPNDNVTAVLVHLHGEHFRKTRSPGWSRSKKRHFRAPERTYGYMRRNVVPGKGDVPLW